ncbi:MAG: transporter [Gammaproteobacteria bacterium]|nr:transporter [Gammaproteobacteria bacterium]
MIEKRNLALSVAIAALIFSGAAAAQNGQWRFSTGSDFSSGDYGGDPVDTEITYVPFTTSYQTDLWTFQATIPWVKIDGAGTVLGAGDGGIVIRDRRRNPGRPEPVPDPVASSDSGIGDIWLSATHAVQAIPSDLFYLDLGVKVKLPTADDDNNLGTGKTDYTFQADIFKPLGNATPFLTLAYKMKGEPSDIALDDVLYVSVGSDFGVSPNTHVGLSVDYQEASFSGSDDSLELFGYVNQSLSSNWSFMLYGYSGLEDGSPDYGVGFQLSYKP